MAEKPTALITGAAGFVGSNTLDYLLEHTDWDFIAVDSFRHKGDSLRLQQIFNTAPYRVRMIRHDLTTQFSEAMINSMGKIDYILNIASESHVDRSITDPVPFVENNVSLALTIGELARKVKPKVLMQMSCYDHETRAFTREGFKFYHQIKKGDSVLTINPETKKSEWKTVEKVIVQDYSGDMVRFKSSIVDMLVTPNHRMFFHDEFNNIAVERADLFLKKSHKRYRLPESAGLAKRKYMAPKSLSKYDAENLFYFSGLFAGDGFISTGDRVFFRIPKEKHCRDSFINCIEALGLDYTDMKNGQIYIKANADLQNHFKDFGHRSVNKSIPLWMLDAPEHLLKRLFDGLMDTDGSLKDTTRKFHTSSDKMALQFCEMAFVLGYQPRIEEMCPTESAINGRAIRATKNHWRIHLRKRQFISNRIASSEKYAGKIWCLKVQDNKNFLTERNGKLAICGNTDEVFGPALYGQFHSEWDIHKPSNPYAASKSAQDQILFSYWRCYGVPLIVTHTMNIFGPMQDKEKFIPMLISKIQKGEKVTIHGSPGDVGSRMYLHVHNLADAWKYIIENQEPIPYIDNHHMDQRPCSFNITGQEEIDNLTLAKIVADIIGKDLIFELLDFHSARPGHDRRYALNGEKLKHHGWKHPYTLRESLESTIQWTLNHGEWM